MKHNFIVTEDMWSSNRAANSQPPSSKATVAAHSSSNPGLAVPMIGMPQPYASPSVDLPPAEIMLHSNGTTQFFDSSPPVVGSSPPAVKASSENAAEEPNTINPSRLALPNMRTNSPDVGPSRKRRKLWRDGNQDS